MKYSFLRTYHIKWSDVDPNNHLRGTVYLDFADATRISFLDSQGITVDYLRAQQIGPILFNVYCEYYKEVKLNTSLKVNCMLDFLSEDNRKFGISHYLINEQDDIVAKVSIKGAFMSLEKRKVIVMPNKLIEALKHMDQSPNNG